VRGTAPPARRQAGQPMSSAECLMHGAAHASHRSPPRPAVNVGGGAHNVAPSAHAIHAGVFGEAYVVADDTHAAGSIAADDWLASTFGGGDSNASGTGACAGDVDDDHFSGFEGRNKALPLLVAVSASKILMGLIVALSMLVCSTAQRVTMMTTARHGHH